MRITDLSVTMFKRHGLSAYKVNPPADLEATIRLCRALRDTLGGLPADD